MGIFRKQSARLLREKWGSADELAEEIYAIFNSDEVLEIDGQVIINNNEGGSSLTINQGNSDDSAFTINNYPDPPINFPEFPPFDPTITSFYITNIYGDGTTEGFPDPTQVPPTPGTGQPLSGGGGVFPGVILSGSGISYQVSVYTAGLASAPVTKTCTAIGLSSEAVIPEGSTVIVFLLGSTYYLDCSRWL